MGTRSLLLWLSVILSFLVGFLAGTTVHAAEAVMFVQPRSPFTTAPPRGTVIPVQIRIEPHADNRSYAIAWCSGGHGRTLEGADAAAIHPEEGPLNVWVPPGECEFVAEVYGPGRKVRARASFLMHVCGGEVACTH